MTDAPGKFPLDTIATGTLTVENKEIDTKEPDVMVVGDNTVEDPNKDIDKNKKPTKEVIILPGIGTKFMVGGHEYKVCYVNEGKKRFSCEPCKGMY